MKPLEHHKVIGVVVVVLSGIAWFTEAAWLGWTAVGIGAITYSFDRLGQLFARGWMAFGKFLGRINSTILLSIFYLLFFTPIALLRRIFDRESTDPDTNWREPESPTTDLTKPW